MLTLRLAPSRLQRALCAVLLLPGLWSPARPLVLCIEPGGQVVVEVGQSACGAPGAPALAHAEAQAPELSAGCCGPCTDLPIGGVQLRQPNSERTLVRLVITSATAPVATAPAVPASPCAERGSGPGCARSLRPAGPSQLTPLRC